MRQNSTAQKLRDTRRQEADRGLGLQTAQILLISMVHKGTVAFGVGSSSTGCCTVGCTGKPSPDRDEYFTPSTFIYSRSKRKAGSENEIKAILFTIALNKITSKFNKKVCNLYCENYKILFK